MLSATFTCQDWLTINSWKVPWKSIEGFRGQYNCLRECESHPWRFANGTLDNLQTYEKLFYLYCTTYIHPKETIKHLNVVQCTSVHFSIFKESFLLCWIKILKVTSKSFLKCECRSFKKSSLWWWWIVVTFSHWKQPSKEIDFRGIKPDKTLE